MSPNSQRKLFCVVEQGSVINQDITLEHKRQFDKPYCDFFRVNWWKKGDPNAQWVLKHSQVSETRNFLYKKTKGKYDYHIVIDDDIRFSTPDGSDVAETIKNNLLTYRPVLASFYSRLRYWKPVDYSQVARCGFINDMDCMVFSADFAEVCYPTIYHGVDWTHDYMFFLALALCPEKYHIYLNVHADNTRYHWEAPDNPHNNVAFDCRTKLLNLARPEYRADMEDYFRLRHRTFTNNAFKHAEGRGENTVGVGGMIFNDACQPDTAVRPISMPDVSRILNTEHRDFTGRRTLQRITDRQKREYLIKNLIIRPIIRPLLRKTRRVLKAVLKP